VPVGHLAELEREVGQGQAADVFGGQPEVARATPLRAVVSGTGDINQGNGCPSAATEACTGPYWLPGSGAARGAENVFPSGGFTVTDDLYLSPSTFSGANSQVDNDWAINTNAGSYGQDEVVSVCKVAGGLALSFGNSSPGTCGASADVTSAGWYRFVEQF
jgi:hypothetical protein